MHLPGFEREEHLDSEHDEEESEDVEIEKERFSCGPGWLLFSHQGPRVKNALTASSLLSSANIMG